MRIYVARHAERIDRSEDSAISDGGHAMARRAGRWLRDDGARLVHVVVTHRQRTLQTAESMLVGMDLGAEEPPLITRRRGIPDRDGLAAFLDELAAEHARVAEPSVARSSPGDVLVVVHHGTQARVETHHCGAALDVPPHHRNAVFRLERMPETRDGWRVTGGWKGSPARPI
jgi:phosphohistidine phosphatase SixA